jgi:hypothetical protein
LPKNMKIRQPRNLTKAVIEEMFVHLVGRQEIHGPEDTLRFKSVKIGSKIVPAKYQNGKGDAVADADAGHRVKRSKELSGRTPRDLAARSPVVRSGGRRRIADGSGPPDAEAQRDAIHQHFDVQGIRNHAFCNDTTFVVVDDVVIHDLRRAGIAIPPPCNGPADGPPKYQVSCNVYHTFEKQNRMKKDNVPPNNPIRGSPQIDPALLTVTPMPTPSPTPVPTPTLARTSRKAKDDARAKIGAQSGNSRRKQAR